MNKWRWVALWLPLLLGGAAAQSGTWSVYFVFRLATSLPLTLQATPECVTERAAWERAPAAPGAPGPRLLETYSFVSPLSAPALREEIEADAREGEFAGTDLPLESRPSLEGVPEPGARGGREFQGRIAPGYRYAVRVYERPNGGGGGDGTASVLCVTVRSDPDADDPDPSLPTDD